MRKILFFDIESTGLDTQTDRIVQLSYLVVDTGFNEIFRHDLFFNPEKPISAEASEVHKITDDMVKDKPKFSEFAQVVFNDFMEAETVLAGFNIIGFDLKLLYKEFERCGLNFEIKGRNVFDTGNLVKLLAPRTLEASFFFFTGETIKDKYGDAHNAMVDVEATASLTATINDMLYLDFEKYNYYPFLKDFPEPDIFKDFWEVYGKASRYGGDMLDVSGNFRSKDGVTTWGFGKFMGKPVDAQDYDQRGLMNWCLGKDFPDDTKSIIRLLLSSDSN
jgi:DNA polymerase-3 subunit epsilon